MQNRKYNTKATIEAGLICALVVVIMLLNVYMPLFSLLGNFILPIPITVLYIRHGYKVAASAVVVSGILIAALYSPIQAFTSMVLFGLVGITLGYCVIKKKTFSTALILLTIANVISNIVNFIVMVNLIDRGGVRVFVDKIVKTLQESASMTKNLYGSMGLTGPQVEQINKMFAAITPEFILQIAPAALFIMSVVFAYLNYVITSKILKKLRYEMQEITPFTKINIPSTFIAALIILMCLGIVLNSRGIAAGAIITASTFLTLQYVFILIGISSAIYLLTNRFGISKPMIALILILTIFTQLSMVYIFLGIIDMVLDLRKLNPNRIRKV